MFLAIKGLSQPVTLQWWQWGKLHGLVNAVGLLVLLTCGVPVPPVVAAVLLHFTVDYSLQSHSVALKKGDRGRDLLIHALANGIPAAIAGLMLSGLSWMTIAAIVVAVVSHYLVDWTRRFNIQSVIVGAAVDQACHILIYVVLFI